MADADSATGGESVPDMFAVADAALLAASNSHADTIADATAIATADT